MHRGDYTLAEFLSRAPGQLEKKSALRQARLTSNAFSEITLQVLEALRDLHDYGFVYLDLKPDNIVYFSKDLKWKLIDMESAVKIGSESKVVATREYAAPELLLNEGRNVIAVEPGADMFSFAIIAYEALTSGYLLSTEINMASDVRYHGERATLQDIEFTLRSMALPPMDCVADRAARNLIKKLLRENPRERLSAESALEQPFFKSAATSSEIICRYGDVRRLRWT